MVQSGILQEFQRVSLMPTTRMEHLMQFHSLGVTSFDCPLK